MLAFVEVFSHFDLDLWGQLAIDDAADVAVVLVVNFLVRRGYLAQFLCQPCLEEDQTVAFGEVVVDAVGFVLDVQLVPALVLDDLELFKRRLPGLPSADRCAR